MRFRHRPAIFLLSAKSLGPRLLRLYKAKRRGVEPLARAPPRDIFSQSPNFTPFSHIIQHNVCNTFSYVGVNLMHIKKSCGLSGLASIFNLPTPFRGMNIVDGTLPILGLEKRTTGPFSTAPSAFDSRGMRQSSWRV